MNCSTLLLSKFQTDNLEANIWLISTIKWHNIIVSCTQSEESEGNLKAKGLLRLFTSTKGVASVIKTWCSHSETVKIVVSVIKTSCAHSVTLKKINKTPHSFIIM